MPVRARLNSLAWDWARAASGVERRLVASMVAGVFAGVTVCAMPRDLSVCLTKARQWRTDEGQTDFAILPFCREPGERPMTKIDRLPVDFFCL